jgi:hypothetical protein
VEAAAAGEGPLCSTGGGCPSPRAELLTAAAALLSSLVVELEAATDAAESQAKGGGTVKPSAWAQRESKYKQDMVALRRTIVAQEEAASRLRDELEAARRRLRGSEQAPAPRAARGQLAAEAGGVASSGPATTNGTTPERASCGDVPLQETPVNTGVCLELGVCGGMRGGACAGPAQGNGITCCGTLEYFVPGCDNGRQGGTGSGEGDEGHCLAKVASEA